MRIEVLAIHAMPLDDPLAWDRQLRLLAGFDDRYRLKLRTNPDSVDSSGPFVGVPPITDRSAFDLLRKLPEELPLRPSLLRWAYRLADSRVNATAHYHLARYWRSEVINLEFPQRITTTRSKMLMQLLRESQSRNAWFSALGEQLSGATELVSELWQRREELARRAGFQSAQSVIDPVDCMQASADAWLVLTGPIAAELLPRDPVKAIDVALAESASQGWPARISSRRNSTPRKTAPWR